MPKIDVSEELFFQALGRRFEEAELVELLTAAKAELDGWDHDAKVLRIELNDTNRPDLWSTLGLARQLGVYLGRPMPAYPFFSRKGDAKPSADRRVIVDAGLADIRPYIVSFVAEGRDVTDALLREIIQSQEKLCGNFGRKRKTIAMGVSRADLITWPVHFRAADPDADPVHAPRLRPAAVDAGDPRGAPEGPRVRSPRRGLPALPAARRREGRGPHLPARSSTPRSSAG